MTVEPLKSAWAWGGYRRGMGGEKTHYRQRFACEALKKELTWVGVTDDLDLSTTRFGGSTEGAVKKFQKQNGLVKDGIVGPKTANALWRLRIESLQETDGIPNDWLRAMVHWESLDDPGAELINTDLSADRGLCMLNSTRKPLTEDEAFTPEVSIAYLAQHLKSAMRRFSEGCASDAPTPDRLAVASWRTPVGAEDWCNAGTIEPDPEGTWGQRAAHYVGRVDTSGRSGWVG